MVTIPKQKDLFLGVNLRVSVCETLLNNSTLRIGNLMAINDYNHYNNTSGTQSETFFYVNPGKKFIHSTYVLYSSRSSTTTTTLET